MVTAIFRIAITPKMIKVFFLCFGNFFLIKKNAATMIAITIADGIMDARIYSQIMPSFVPLMDVFR